MLTVNFVNLLQVGLISISLLGCLLFYRQPPFRTITLLLALVIIAQVFNLLEELNISRTWYLVTPIFVIGFGPATYIAVKGVIENKLSATSLWHLAPMLIALPFTNAPEYVIAVGTLWRVVYALLTLKLLFAFQKYVNQNRSDALELDLNWLAWLVGVMTLVSLFDLIRLNIQPFITQSWNIFGQGIGTFFSFLFFCVLIVKLISQKDAFLALVSHKEFTQDSNDIKTSFVENADLEPEAKAQNDEASDYREIFEHLSHQIKDNEWYKVPRLTLTQLAEKTSLQTRDISRAINLIAEKSFNEYINQLRLEYVVNEIKSGSSKSFITLAHDAGFNSKSTFNLAFKRAYQMTPLDYQSSLKT